MNITFFIGNGFDLAIGLKTDYKSFIRYYVDNKKEVSQTVEKFKDNLRCHINNEHSDSEMESWADLNELSDPEIENWADLEEYFGKYTEFIKTEDDVIGLYSDILEELKLFLGLEEKKIDFKKFNNETMTRVENDIVNFYRELPLEDKNKFLKNTRISSVNENIYINFILFNYTSCLEMTVSPLKNKSIYQRSVPNGTYTTHIKEILYLHGNIKDNNIIFGVDNRDQLFFKGEKSNRLLRRVIKPVKNTSLKNNVNNIASNHIKDSSIICLFGTSIGNTDSSWWKKIGVWLTDSTGRQLIIYMFDSDLALNSSLAITEDVRLDLKERYADFFIHQANIDVNKFPNVIEQINVIVCSEIFQHNLVELLNQKLKDEAISILTSVLAEKKEYDLLNTNTLTTT